MSKNRRIAGLTLSFLILAGIGTVVSSCQGTRTDAARNVDPHVVMPSSTASPPTEANINIATEELCARLREIESIPDDRFEKTGDPIYDGLMARGTDAVPCLVDKITDTEKIGNPEVMPEAPDLRVGDAAVFMLMAITGQSWKPSEMFPAKYAEKFKSQGMYAYFAYMQKPENRKKFQGWWRHWMEENLKQ